jgi:acetyl esterase/lipase
MKPTTPASIRPWARFLALFAAAGALAGCSAISLLNTLAPTGDLEIQRDITYGDDPRFKLDVYRKRDLPPGAPVIVFFYGGSWDSGERGNYLFVAEALASRGFVAVLPDYRVYPAVTFPTFLDDAAAAVAWTKRNAGAYGGNPGKVFVMGHSAGAHIAAMVSLDPQFLARQGLTPAALSGFIGLAGPYDFLPLKDETLKKIFAPETTIARTQPINFVSASAPPALLMTGEKDTAVSPGNTVRLAAKLRKDGRPVTEVHYPDCNHYTIVGLLAAPFRKDEPILDEIDRFVRAN